MNCGQVFLPPEVFVVLGSKGCEEIVAVHNDVDECIQKPKKAGVAAGSEFYTEPNGHRHDTVVDDVKRGHVIIFLSKNKEKLKKKYI